MKFLVIAALISMSVSSFAKSSDSSPHYESVDQWKKTTIPNSADFLNMFSEVKTEIDGLIGNLEPARVKLLLNSLFKYSQFNAKTKQLTLGLYNGKILSSQDRVTLAHEYGHAIFERYYPWNDEFYDGEVRTSFHELFADIVAITYTENPKALSKLVLVSPAFMSRDFSIDGAQHYKNWFKKFNNEDRIVESYPMMNPVRWAFWDLVKDKIHSDSYRRKMIPVFFEVIQPYFIEALQQLEKERESIRSKEMIVINEKIVEGLYESDLRNP